MNTKADDLDQFTRELRQRMTKLAIEYCDQQRLAYNKELLNQHVTQLMYASVLGLNSIAEQTPIPDLESAVKNMLERGVPMQADW